MSRPLCVHQLLTNCCEDARNLLWYCYLEVTEFNLIQNGKEWRIVAAYCPGYLIAPLEEYSEYIEKIVKSLDRRSSFTIFNASEALRDRRLGSDEIPPELENAASYDQGGIA